MSYNTYPQNPFPSNSEMLQKLDAVAKAIEDIPTFTSNDKAFLDELPTFPSEDGKKVLTATTESGETSLSYEEIENELPTEPSADGVKVLTATTESGETSLSWEDKESKIDYSTTEQLTGQKWIDGKPLYQKVISVASLPNNTTVDYPHNISSVDHIFIAGGFAEDSQSGLSAPLNFPGSDGQWQWNTSVDKTVIRVWAGKDRTAFDYVKVILNYTKTTDTPTT